MENQNNESKNYINNSLTITKNEFVINSHHKNIKIPFSKIKNIYLKKTINYKLNYLFTIMSAVLMVINILIDFNLILNIFIYISSSIIFAYGIIHRDINYKLIISQFDSTIKINIPVKYKDDAKKIISKIRKINNIYLLLLLFITISCNKTDKQEYEIFDETFKNSINSILKIDDVNSGIIYIKFYKNGKFEEVELNPDSTKTFGTWKLKDNLITVKGLYSIKSIQIINIKKERIELYLIMNNNKAFNVVGIFLKDMHGNNINEFSKIERRQSNSFFD